MPVYMIGYDLHPSSAEDYDKLYDALEAVGSGYWDCLESTWLLIKEKTGPNNLRTQAASKGRRPPTCHAVWRGGPRGMGSRMIVGFGSKINFEVPTISGGGG